MINTDLIIITAHGQRIGFGQRQLDELHRYERETVQSVSLAAIPTDMTPPEGSGSAGAMV